MDEFTTITATLKKITEQLEDNSLQNHITKNSKYIALQSHLSTKGYVDYNIFQKVLNICIRDLEEDIKYTAIALKIIITILKKIKDEAYSPDPANLVPLAVYIIHKINITSTISKVDNLRDLYINTIHLFPKETLISIVSDNEALIVELLKSHNYAQLQLEYKILLYEFLYKLLKILPSKMKLSFMNSITSVLFSKFIPSILDEISCTADEKKIVKSLDVLEYITSELAEIDYFKTSQWMSFLENICNPKKYPQMMKNLLERESQVWHRLWIIFIKLLKNQITSNIISSGTPINSMLPIVETAFKLDTRNRCRAFQCWTVLTNNFSCETNENCINKRLKLLIIPLKLNNAKVEETAIAKFNSWWHLIIKFQFKLEKFVEQILISFLHFCFGKHNSSGKSNFTPGQISDFLRKQGIEALVEIIGHVNCSGCVEITSLEGKLINKTILANYWMDWTHSLKVAIQFSLDNIDDSVSQHVLCLLRSFILTMSCLPSNKIKDDIINDLLSMLSKFVQESKQHNSHYADTVFTLLLSFFIDELNIKEILSIKDENQSTLYRIVKLTLDASFKKYYELGDKQEIVHKLKPMVKVILDDSVGIQYILDNILNNLPTNDITLTFWAALVECICQSDKDNNLQNVFNVFIWPLESFNMFHEVKYPAKLWYRTYSMLHSKFGKGDFDREVSQILHSSNIVTNSSIYFALYVILAILKRGLMEENTNQYETDVQLLQVLSKRIDCYEDIEELFPTLVDTLIHVLQCYTKSNNGELVETIIICVKNLLKLMMPVFKGNSGNNEIHTTMERLLKALDLVSKSETYKKFTYMFKDFSTFYSSVFQNLTLSIFTKSSSKDQESITCNKGSTERESKLNIENKAINNQIMECGKLSTPNIKEAKKKMKKTKASIVNTIVENGEEFVVVKSNWKFNPKKLTENQKEKFKRKREDIPALYQDLSQSQDDINLKTWKSDSQDTTTTSKSCSISTNEGKNTSSILKNLPSTEVVPKILENILAEKVKNVSEVAQNEVSKSKCENDKQLTNKFCKTPRMALQDRVFRNVRNLIEKSKKESFSGDADTTYNQIETTITTPVKVWDKDITSLVQSEPPMPLADRPSRVKRKPKKFDGTEIFDLKKRNLQKDNIINDDDSQCEKIDVIEKPLPNETIVDDIAGNKLIVNQNVNIDNDKGIVKSKSVLEQTKCLRVKLIKNGIDKIIDKSNSSIIKLSPDLKCVQGSTSVTQKPEDDCQSASCIGIDISSEQTSPTHGNNDVHKSPVEGVIKKRKSRIENQLAIDMAVGYLHLNTPLNAHKRSTRKTIRSNADTPKKRRLTDKLNQSTVENKVQSKQDKKTKSVNTDSQTNSVSITATEAQEQGSIIDNLPSDDICSEDVIESSQDSTMTSVTVMKRTSKKIPVVCIENIQLEPKPNQIIIETQKLLEDEPQKVTVDSSGKEVTESCSKMLEKETYATSMLNETKTLLTKTVSELLSESDCQNIKSNSSEGNQQNKDDTELPQNKTHEQNNSENDLTENMNTQEICDNDLSADIMIIDKEKLTPIIVSSNENLMEIVSSQEIADAPTQPVNTAEVMCLEFEVYDNTTKPEPFNNNINENKFETKNIDSQEDKTKTITELENLSTNSDKIDDISSPFKDDVQRKQEFMNSTIEISPIKTMSPNICEDKLKSPDKTPEYVVIVLASPVRSNGEPVQKESPEIFTEEKTPDNNIEYSPTRSENTVSNTSPSSALSLKKNRPQVRGGGRAAQMLDLCVPEKLQSLMCSDKTETEEVKKNNHVNTPARRNLRIMYNCINDNNDKTADNEVDSGNFLKLNRLVPPSDSSPSGPILKRKFIDIIDDVTISPASKRKRVSFHDPPVSTTVSVQKYIEPSGVRSPQNSAQKRYERQSRSQNCMKSPRRLDNVFNLNNALTKAVESFTDVDLPPSTEDSQMIEQTPVTEIVKTSELDDSQPIFQELFDCKDPIENIAAELSSAAMKSLLIKELEGKIETIGDLAKMTEVEVNRLCIKTPKVKVAKQALNAYHLKLTEKDTNLDNTVNVLDVVESDDKTVENIETQTDKVIVSDMETQTTAVSLTATLMQTDVSSSSTVSIQTDESGFKSTAEIIKTCISERHDFMEQLTVHIGETEMQTVAERLSFTNIADIFLKNINESNISMALSRLLDHKCIQKSTDKNSQENQLSYIRDYLLEKFNSKDLNLFCIKLLLELHDKSI